MYLLKPSRKLYTQKVLVFDTVEQLIDYTKTFGINKFCVTRVDKFLVPEPKEPNPQVELKQRLVPLSQAASDQVKF